MGRLLQIAGLAVGLFALILQFCITVPASMMVGRGLFGSIVFYFSFFTILTNIGVVLVYASLLSASSYAWLPWRICRTRRGFSCFATCCCTM